MGGVLSYGMQQGRFYMWYPVYTLYRLQNGRFYIGFKRVVFALYTGGAFQIGIGVQKEKQATRVTKMASVIPPSAQINIADEICGSDPPRQN